MIRDIIEVNESIEPNAKEIGMLFSIGLTIPVIGQNRNTFP